MISKPKQTGMARKELHGINCYLTCQVSYETFSQNPTDHSECISPSVMLPERRLAILLQQVKRNQISNCLYHNTSTSPSLYQDHACQPDHFPRYPSKDLTKHTGEVWQVQFSHDGKRLASCGGDGTVLIYDVESWDVLQSLAHSEGGICSLAWSPDDTMMVTVAMDKDAVLWNTLVSSTRYL